MGGKTFKQRYLVQDKWWNRGKGPIFFYTGNEGPITEFWAATGFIFDIAPQFGALIVFAEHCGNRVVKAFANSLDPDETPQNVASHLDPNCKPLRLASYRHTYMYVHLVQCGNRILKAFANSLDPDETPQNVASHQDPNSLLF
ncbi:hypothetical protein DPMN_145187 [Dreissena polymorpha]|uniref:Uncharacterized protein n=1 Tax=Dreissena polymorpha TaxID=45954 RepID=A0A9D4F676_DREPO|nr:hypothetical protein DPMN_145187 [Dreissena polymorpha]